MGADREVRRRDGVETAVLAKVERNRYSVQMDGVLRVVAACSLHLSSLPAFRF